MRDRIKELMKKEDGFTLVELLAVIAILAIIVAIAIPAIGNVVSDSQDKADVAQIELIEDAARLYYTTTDKDDWEHPVSVGTLRDEGFLDERAAEDLEGEVSRDDDNGSVTYSSEKAD